MTERDGSGKAGPSDRGRDSGAGAESGVARVPAELLAGIRADLAQRTGAADASIELIEAERVRWPDSSLGCPQPGQGYLQVITPGYRLLMRAGGEEHSYHASERGHFVLCKRPAAQPPRPRDDAL